MIRGYNLVKLEHMMDELGEDKVKPILLSFSCPLNRDVEHFLHNVAIEFTKQGLAVTYLVFTSHKSEITLIGYFALANKPFVISQKILSSTKRKRYGKFGVFEKDLKRYWISAPLIGQLSKNFTNGVNKLITGDELLKLACDKVLQAQTLIGGRIVYLECEPCVKLMDFYERNGFVEFGRRELELDEVNKFSEKYLIQMLKDFKSKSTTS